MKHYLPCVIFSVGLLFSQYELVQNETSDGIISPDILVIHIGHSVFFSKPDIKQSKNAYLLYICTLHLLRSSDCETNPGPRQPKYPCQICTKACRWRQRAIACDNCEDWYHVNCLEMISQNYQYHAKPDASWICCTCGIPNFSTSLFESFNVDTSNHFDILSDTDSSSNSILDPGSPLYASSPRKLPSTDTNTSKHRFRVISLNAQSICSKKASLMNLTESSKPDVIVLTETWLRPDVHDNEYLPPGYQTQARRDRPDGYGGVAILTKSTITCELHYTSKLSELTAISIDRENNPPVIIAALYRPPNNKEEEAEQVCSEIEDLVRAKPNAPFWLTGDFNLPDISWTTNTIKGNQNLLSVNNKFISLFEDLGLQQMVDFPTRKENTLDLFLTNRPSIVNRITALPGISDHEAIFFDSEIQIKHNRPTPRKIYLWNKADSTTLKAEMKKFSENFTETKKTTDPVEELWQEFKNGILNIQDKHVPSKMTSQRFSQPWITSELKRLSKKKDRAYKKYSTSKSQKDYERYKDLKNEVHVMCKNRENEYINNIIFGETSNPKRLWSFIKSKRTDTCGISPLKRDGITYSDTKVKANILNDQFTSVFTVEDENEPLPDMGPSPHPKVPTITVTRPGVEKLLKNLDPHKATGPDEVSTKILKETATEVTPALTLLFQASINQGTAPNDWKAANITPLFKKGDKSQASNYRPVSLTSVCSKVLEHIVHSNVISHLDQQGILSDFQHGFRKNCSTETQLIMSINDLACSLDVGEQVDCVLLDFSKAFDKVPHNRLMLKLAYYGIDGSTYDWIHSFLFDRLQRVVLDGQQSSTSSVTSGVPQGTVLGPLLFLLYINDLPSQVKSTARLFADDCLLYKIIRSSEDQNTLQQDLDRLQIWEDTWLMRFNPDKCEVIQISNRKIPKPAEYKIHGQILNITDSAKYLGLHISKNLSWDKHIDSTTKKANSTLAFLRRNISKCPPEIKSQCYSTLVRPTMEYASSVWNPQKKNQINKLEAVQRRAARFVTGDYQRTSSVTSMLNQLQWPTLQERRETAQVIMMYKITYQLVAIPLTLLQPAPLRTRGNSLKYHIPFTRTTVYRASYFPTAIRLWNQLPESTVQATTLDSFKTLLSSGTVH